MLLSHIANRLVRDKYKHTNVQALMPFIHDIFIVIARLLEEEGVGAKIMIIDFGKFTLIRKRSYTIKRGLTKIKVPSNIVLNFKCSKKLRSRLNKNRPAFSPEQKRLFLETLPFQPEYEDP